MIEKLLITANTEPTSDDDTWMGMLELCNRYLAMLSVYDCPEEYSRTADYARRYIEVLREEVLDRRGLVLACMRIGYACRMLVEIDCTTIAAERKVFKSKFEWPEESMAYIEKGSKN